MRCKAEVKFERNADLQYIYWRVYLLGGGNCGFFQAIGVFLIRRRAKV